MASNKSSLKFRVTLLKVSDILTDKNAMDIAYLFEEISPDKRKLITNAKELFDELRRQTLLHEDKVDVLIEYLDELELSKASGILKDYRGSNTGSVTGSCYELLFFFSQYNFSH